MGKRRDATGYIRLTLAESKVEHGPSETGLVVDEPGDQVDQSEQTEKNPVEKAVKWYCHMRTYLVAIPMFTEYNTSLLTALRVL
jgi:hypothetical protein